MQTLNSKSVYWQSRKPWAVVSSLMTLAVVFMIGAAIHKGAINAANPTFALTGPSSGTVGQSITLTVTVDGSGEQLLGAEVNIPYDTSKVSITQITFSGGCIFESCINLSETGTIKLLAASGLPPEGQAVTSLKNFATITMDLVGAGNAAFNFSKAQVINSSQNVESRGATGKTVAINPVASGCGDNNIDSGETCDDGNLVAGDGCSATCQSEAGPVCGNGIAEGSEECDDGNSNNSDSCSTSCHTVTPSGVCGNGAVESGEQCDDGNSNNSDSCSNACTTVVAPGAVCGNGITEGAEQCDDGNGNNDDGCSNACLNTVVTPSGACGNSVVEGSETCDDGNTAQEDGCSATCHTQTLVSINLSTNPTLTAGSNGQLIANATFSDGYVKNITSPNTNPGMSYSSSNPAVGNLTCASCSQVHGSVPGTTVITATYTFNSVTKTDTQTITVVPAPPAPEPTPEPTEPTPAPVAVCGNGTVEEPEVCDDGNLESNDGCSASCLTELQVAPEPETPAQPSVSAVCGNAVVEANEECDDGNTQDGDGCTASCTAEISLKPSPLAASIEVPLTVQDRDTRVNTCQGNPYFSGINLGNNGNNDSDGDGLSDKTECYSKTDPRNPDTDQDGCADGDEVNLFGNDPVQKDCSVDDIISGRIVITDPQTGWLLAKLESVSGIVPDGVGSVKLILTNAEGSFVKAMQKAVASGNKEEISGQLELLRAFLKDAHDYDYGALSAAADEIESKLKEEKADWSTVADSLKAMAGESMIIGSVETLSDTRLSGKAAKHFEWNGAAELKDNQLYQLIATGTLNGKTLVSAPVRFGLDSSLKVTAPVPRSIGEAVIGGATAFGSFNAYAENGEPAVVEIENNQPMVVGDSEFGSQVYGIWNSLVLSSSVIADSEKGAFSIQAPGQLEKDITHKVTLYALKTNGDQKMRSDSVNVFFRIKHTPFPWSIVLMGLAALIVLGGGTLYLRKTRMKTAMNIATPEAQPADLSTPFKEAVKSAQDSAQVFDQNQTPTPPSAT